jgi:hypothetical protein
MYSEGSWELPTPRNLILDRLEVNTPSLSGTPLFVVFLSLLPHLLCLIRLKENDVKTVLTD